METDGGVVEISWPADRRRYAKAVREFPSFRKNRRLNGPFLVASLIVLVIGVALGSSIVRAVGIGLVVGSTLVHLVFLLTRFLLIRQTIDGTIRWTIDHAGIRIEGNLTYEVPWTEVDSWYITGDHLIIVLRTQWGRRSQSPLGVPAPLGAFSDAEIARTRSMLQDHVGPEST